MLPSATLLLFIFLSSHPQSVRVSPTLVTGWLQQVQALQPHVTVFLSKEEESLPPLSPFVGKENVFQKTPSKLPLCLIGQNWILWPF